MNPFVSRINNQPWVWPVTGLCLVLGFMISMAWVTETNRKTRIGLIGLDQQKRVSEAQVDLDKFYEFQEKVGELQTKLSKTETAMASQSGQAKLLNEGLQEAKFFAGLTSVEGPGVVVTLRDDPKAEDPTAQGSDLGGLVIGDQIIHDLDVLRVVNEIFAAGAEAVAVNDIRVSAGSYFRCVGPVIKVNDIPVATPIAIKAIGDPAALYGGMNTPGGILAEIRRQNTAMVQVQKVDRMTLPAYAGTTAKRVAKVPKDKK